MDWSSYYPHFVEQFSTESEDSSEDVKAVPRLTKEVVLTDKSPAPMACISQCVKVGDFVFVSGILPIAPDTKRFVEGTVGARTVSMTLDVYTWNNVSNAALKTQILTNITNILEESGSHIQNVVKINIWLDDMKNFKEMNLAYEKVFCEGVRPVSTRNSVSKVNSSR